MLGRPAAAQHRATATNPPNPHRMLSAHPHPAAARNQHFAHRSHDEHTTKHEPTQLRGNLTTCKIPKSSMHRAATTSTRRHTPGRCQSQWRQHQSLGAQPAPNGIVHDSTSNTVLGFLNPSYPLSLVPFALPGLLLIVVIHLGQSPLPMPLVSFPKPSKLSTILPGENPISLLLVRDVLPHVASPIVGPLLPTLSLHSPTDELTSVHQTAAVTHQCPAAMRYPINNLALVDSTSYGQLGKPCLCHRRHIHNRRCRSSLRSGAQARRCGHSHRLLLALLREQRRGSGCGRRRSNGRNRSCWRHRCRRWWRSCWLARSGGLAGRSRLRGRGLGFGRRLALLHTAKTTAHDH
mmetsp:Transcript_92516/g.211861  ORF Transcript_92516/g.211861 Transcript_92516/m.211861 type:complete len:349 (-) Transcript_92516:18-1064(-)